MSGRFAFNPSPQAPASQQGSAVPIPAPAPTNTAQQTRPVKSPDQRLWETIENSSDASEFDYYLQKYPDGEYADVARIKKKRLTRQAQAPTATVASEGPQTTGGNNADAGRGFDASTVCRMLSAGDQEMYTQCVEEYGAGNSGYSFGAQDDMPSGNTFPQTGAMPPGAQGAVWYDDEFMQWQVSMNGNSFNASTFYPGTGQITLSGQSQGNAVSYVIYDASGLQIGYGQGNIDDASHISVTSYWANGAFLGSTRFHVNHQPN